jgi:hypothetical protein
MFKITSTQAINWPSFALRKGVNVFTSRKAVPAELWEKLDRFRGLKLLDFEGQAEPGEDTGPKLETLSQKQLYALSKAELSELAKGTDLSLPDDASKAVLLGELEKRLAPGAIAAPPSPPPAPAGEKPNVTIDSRTIVVANRRGSRGADPAPSES